MRWPNSTIRTISSSYTTHIIMSDEITKQTIKRIARKEARNELESQLSEINGEEKKTLADLIGDGLNSSDDEVEADAEGEGEDPDIDHEQVEQMAGDVMLTGDAHTKLDEGLTNRETIKKKYFVDPADYSSVEELRKDVRAARESKRSSKVGR